MSVSVQQILGFLRAVAPQELALDWDNVGLLVDAGQPVDGVLTTLDITPAVVREAVENDCQLIVSHHPVIFHPLRTLAADDVPALLMKNGISAICMHTNLDAAPGGVNDTLCDILGIAAEGREVFPAMEKLYGVRFRIPKYSEFCTAIGAALDYKRQAK